MERPQNGNVSGRQTSDPRHGPEMEERDRQKIGKKARPGEDIKVEHAQGKGHHEDDRRLKPLPGPFLQGPGPHENEGEDREKRKLEPDLKKRPGIKNQNRKERKEKVVEEIFFPFKEKPGKKNPGHPACPDHGDSGAGEKNVTHR